MSDPMTYSFYGTTIPALKKVTQSAISILTSAKTELSTAANGTLPTELEVLDSHFGTMLPFRMQPIFMAKFASLALDDTKLTGSVAFPPMIPSFTSFDEVIDFCKKVGAALDAIDEKAFNASAEKSCSIFLDGPNKTLNLTGLADYFHSFVMPNSYFHVSAMYMLLRSKGFSLGKTVYIGSWMSPQLVQDFAPLRG
ncbi:hypothetical protein IAQ61_009266 [Plenodomus lingam]|uniref:DUF1993 domain-containing protein n=1 Tax=Leptosphaeria maculans (strain JN3 / isolate v23.1.3 / race Av1-4-5-6-7-8) TaxID=985895 RepID=E4ZP56_LEPMJ|nr:hypothetical protein LEMA_P044860.1 [Plenodomus lingam JN3]KAH9865319.1 hypothetical protein IAQ61_009266 [Plenodomus lingam]CBX93585.1 hypothetical protein LEMA_P044860.1 [Plenodomus lingam JN3]